MVFTYGNVLKTTIIRLTLIKCSVNDGCVLAAIVITSNCSMCRRGIWYSKHSGKHKSQGTRVGRHALEEGILELGYQGRLSRTWISRRKREADSSSTDAEDTENCLKR